jgi:tRNA-2-methylthio-N6-dimethylallyladenosine synthase
MVEGAKAHLRSLRIDYEADPQQRFELPERHPEFAAPRPGRAFVTVMEGCDLFCAFCVVPRTRGREVSRSSESILAEVQAAAQRGVVEVTLLGQTVNAYGRARPGRAVGEIPFAELLRRVAEVSGIERVRFTSPHPMFVTPDLVRAYAEEPRICPHLHLPVQSGSSRVLAAMNRRYDRQTYLSIVADVRKARSDVAITTDLIVGFPGETRADFSQTLSLMSEVGFADSFSYKYSERPGTPILRRSETPVPAEEAQARLEELQSLQRQLTLQAHRARVGETCRVLVDGPSRKGGLQQSGRCPQNRVVNFTASPPPRPGTLAEVRIVDCTPHSLLAEVQSTESPSLLPLL